MFIMFITTLNWDFSVVQWSRHCSFNGGGVGAIPRQGTRSYMLCGAAKKTHKKPKTDLFTDKNWSRCYCPLAEKCIKYDTFKPVIVRRK